MKDCCNSCVTDGCLYACSKVGSTLGDAFAAIVKGTVWTIMNPSAIFRCCGTKTYLQTAKATATAASVSGVIALGASIASPEAHVARNLALGAALITTGQTVVLVGMSACSSLASKVCSCCSR